MYVCFPAAFVVDSFTRRSVLVDCMCKRRGCVRTCVCVVYKSSYRNQTSHKHYHKHKHNYKTQTEAQRKTHPYPNSNNHIKANTYTEMEKRAHALINVRTQKVKHTTQSQPKTFMKCASYMQKNIHFMLKYAHICRYIHTNRRKHTYTHKHAYAGPALPAAGVLPVPADCPLCASPPPPSVLHLAGGPRARHAPALAYSSNRQSR